MNDIQPLEQHFEIFSGHHFRGKIKGLPSGPIQVLQPRDFKAGEVQHTPLRIFDTENNILYSRQELQNKDILLPNKGTLLHPVWFQAGDLHSVATSSFFVIRQRNTGALLPKYVYWLLQQPIINRYLLQALTKSTVPSLSVKPVRAMEIPVPPRNTQEHIAELVDQVQQEKELLKQKMHNRQKWLNSYCWERLQPHLS